MRLNSRLNDPFDVEIAVFSPAWPDYYGFTTAGIGRGLIGLANRKYRHHAQLVTGSRNANGNFAAIGDQKAME